MLLCATPLIMPREAAEGQFDFEAVSHGWGFSVASEGICGGLSVFQPNLALTRNEQ